MSPSAAFENTESQNTSDTEIWTVASKWLTGKNHDVDAWWSILGPLMAKFTLEAGWSAPRQFEIQMFLYSHVLPFLGPPMSHQPSSRPRHTLNDEGSPIEFSWKWNGPSSAPEVRICIEPIGGASEWPIDSQNYRETKHIVTQLAKVLPELDRTLFDHFAQVFHLDDARTSTDHAQKHVARNYVAFEFLGNATIVKAYFQFDAVTPPSLADVMGLIRGSLSNPAALDELATFMSHHPIGATLRQEMLAVDCIDPAKSRLKLYAVTEATSFNSVISVMTLGGNIKCTEDSINELAVLFSLCLGLPEDFSRTDELLADSKHDANVAHPFWGLWKKTFTYHFDISSSASLPDVKGYLPVDTCGKSEVEVAVGLKTFLASRGRGKYSDGFLRFLRRVAQDFTSDDDNHRVQKFIAFWFKNGSLGLTSYVGPYVYRD